MGGPKWTQVYYDPASGDYQNGAHMESSLRPKYLMPQYLDPLSQVRPTGQVVNGSKAAVNCDRTWSEQYGPGNREATHREGLVWAGIGRWLKGSIRICVCVHVSVHQYTYVYISTYTYMHMYVYIYRGVDVCIYAYYKVAKYIQH